MFPLLFFLAVLGVEPRVSGMLGRSSHLSCGPTSGFPTFQPCSIGGKSVLCAFLCFSMRTVASVVVCFALRVEMSTVVYRAERNTKRHLPSEQLDSWPSTNICVCVHIYNTYYIHVIYMYIISTQLYIIYGKLAI